MIPFGAKLYSQWQRKKKCLNNSTMRLEIFLFEKSTVSEYVLQFCHFEIHLFPGAVGAELTSLLLRLGLVKEAWMNFNLLKSAVLQCVV